ncbi:hypothetical protein SASPL_142641 [Salvia splendens]|uniref:non-specific serine/threonine protein kinase n=1 Tax=Salvia splendens TaxID=180675 RepID=A0A8X8WKJ2_SALSN|nr:hypothetical protein SASPL_142641 [Salvia splendens]
MTIATVILLFANTSFADPRAQVIKLICGKQTEQNATINVANFISTMEKITLQMQNSGHGAAETGSGRHKSYGFAQCYGDLSPTDCTLCYVEARNILPQCYPSNGGRAYLEGCFIRAENYSFYDEFSGPGDGPVCGNRTRAGPGFDESVRKGLSQVVSVASGNERYGRAEVAVGRAVNESVYVMADCWRTINATACRACLENASASLLGCLPRADGRALNTGCFVQYSDTDFMNSVSNSGSSRGRVIVNVIVAVSGVALFIGGVIIGVYVWKRRIIARKRRDDAEKLVKNLNHSSLNFKYSTLERATVCFDETNKLGQGGFGTGVLADGREIAAKRLFFNNKHRVTDFYNEVNMVSSVEHKNLVRLLGCSCSGPERLLVYEFCSNKSLDAFIFDLDKGKELDWDKRLKIIVGTAEGLVYLHENTSTRIIHRDIKASNILLDSRMRAKIADFGLARSFEKDQSHISTAIAGTLVSSQNILQSTATQSGTEFCMDQAWKQFKQGTVEPLVDHNLMLGLGGRKEEADVMTEMVRVVQIGLVCTQEIPSSRPSMSKALLMLEAKEEPPLPSNPPFMDKETMEFHYSSQGSNDASVATISHTVFLPRDASYADPRAQIIKLTCGTHPTLNTTATFYVPNFFASVDNVSLQVRTSHSAMGTSLCYAEAHTNVPRCHPAATTTIASSTSILVRTTRFGWARVRPGKDESNSAYVLAECWRTFEAGGLPWECLPASEGRALYTGCFMRYSDTNFLNPMPGNGNLGLWPLPLPLQPTAAVIGAVIGFYVWKKRTIQKKRKGDAEKMLKNLIDRNLHFNYSTVEKATDSEKADVYSFGVLLIEIVTGIQNNGSQNSDFIDSMLTRGSCIGDAGRATTPPHPDESSFRGRANHATIRGLGTNTRS